MFISEAEYQKWGILQDYKEQSYQLSSQNKQLFRLRKTNTELRMRLTALAKALEEWNDECQSHNVSITDHAHLDPSVLRQRLSAIVHQACDSNIQVRKTTSNDTIDLKGLKASVQYFSPRKTSKTTLDAHNRTQKRQSLPGTWICPKQWVLEETRTESTINTDNNNSESDSGSECDQSHEQISMVESDLEMNASFKDCHSVLRRISCIDTSRPLRHMRPRIMTSCR